MWLKQALRERSAAGAQKALASTMLKPFRSPTAPALCAVRLFYAGEGPRSERSGGLLSCVSGIGDPSAAGMQQAQVPDSVPPSVLEAVFSMETSTSTVSLSSPTVTVMVAVTVAMSPTSGCV